jgi:hypothetical protein
MAAEHRSRQRHRDKAHHVDEGRHADSAATPVSAVNPHHSELPHPPGHLPGSDARHAHEHNAFATGAGPHQIHTPEGAHDATAGHNKHAGISGFTAWNTASASLGRSTRVSMSLTRRCLRTIAGSPM